eukprot:11316092-Karenia_brevis.AAC.1
MPCQRRGPQKPPRYFARATASFAPYPSSFVHSLVDLFADSLLARPLVCVSKTPQDLPQASAPEC